MQTQSLDMLVSRYYDKLVTQVSIVDHTTRCMHGHAVRLYRKCVEIQKQLDYINITKMSFIKKFLISRKIKQMLSKAVNALVEWVR